MAPSLVQAQLSCTPDEKDAFLLLLLRTRLANGRTILFANAITALQRLKALLTLLEVPALVLQGGMQQRARLKALERFREGGEHASVLLATDVAARGLDIEGVEYVVHYQLPRSAEVYVHRSGRTARAAASGLSIALIEPADHKTYALSTAHTHSMRVLTTAPSPLPRSPQVPAAVPRAGHAGRSARAPDRGEDVAAGARGSLDRAPTRPGMLIATDDLPCMQVLTTARQLDQAAHQEARRASTKNFRQKLQREMDLPSDSDDDEGGDDDEVERRRKLAVSQEKQRLSAQLKRILSRLERPHPGVPMHEVARAMTSSAGR